MKKIDSIQHPVARDILPIQMPHKRPTTVEYRPDFFRPLEWQFLQAVCLRLIPEPQSQQVAEFIDQHMHTPYAYGEADPEQVAQPEPRASQRKSLRNLLRGGMAAMEKDSQRLFQGLSFTQLTASSQEDLLQAAKQGHLQWGKLSCAEWFTLLHEELQLGLQSVHQIHSSDYSSAA